MRNRRKQIIGRWLARLPGIWAGLFLARFIVEVSGAPWSIPLIALITGSLATLGFIGSRWLARRQRQILWTGWILLIYVLWPWRAPLVAGSVLTIACLSWLLTTEEETSQRTACKLIDIALFLIGILVYGLTASSDILPADSGEFQLVAARLGVAHPPGYPLYTLLGHLFIRLVPLGTPASRLNLLSALMAAGAVTLLGAATRIWARRLGASPLIALGSGVIASLALGTATTFWAQATIANIRTPTALCMALALFALARLASTRRPAEADRSLTLLGLALGLGLGHHASLVFSVPFFLLYVLLIDPRIVRQPKRWLRPAVALALGLLPYAYLPIAGALNAPLAPPGLNTLQGFLHHALARGFSGDMFAYANAADLPHRLALLPMLLTFQFNGVLLAAAGVSALLLLWHDWRLALLLLGCVLSHTFVTITYRAPQTVEYLMPAYLPMSVAMGLAAASLARALTSRLPSATVTGSAGVACGLILWASLVNGWRHAPSFVELSTDRTARETVGPLLQDAPQDALLLADWRWVTPLWYLQQVEGKRPDVDVEYVYNVAGEEYWDTWERWVRAAPTDRPLLMTHFYDFEGYVTEPWHAGFLVRKEPVTEAVAPLNSVDAAFGEKVQLVGYRLHYDELQPGRLIECTLAWRPLEPLDQTPSFTLRLVDANERRVAQADRSLNTATPPGEIRFERLVLPLYPELAPGDYQLRMGGYEVTSDGFRDLPINGETTLTLKELSIRSRRRPAFTRNRQTIPFQHGPTLIGIDYDRSVPDRTRIYLHWTGPIAAAGLSVHVLGSEGNASRGLPTLPAGGYQTTVLEIPAVEGSSDRLMLSLQDEAGELLQAAGPWSAPRTHTPLPTVPARAQFVPIGDAVALIGARGRPAPPGEVTVIDAFLVGLHPLTTDLATSVRLTDADGRWLARHDMQPGLGAVPTLKWIRGSYVVDRHLLPVPADFSGEQLRAALVVYERFRELTLPSLDGRFRDVPLGSWSPP